MRNMLLFAVLFALPSQLYAQAEQDGFLHWDVDGINEAANELGYTFKMKRNWVTEYLNNGGSINDVTGLKHPDLEVDGVLYDDIDPPNDLPESFDWREQVEGGLQPIKNQGSCGSCWAFSVVAVIESLLKIEDASLEPDLAEQTLVSRCSNSGSCSGGYFSAFNYTKKPGLPDEAQDPYKAYNTSCKSNLEPVQKIHKWAYVGSKGKAPSVEQVKAAIFHHGPLAVTVNGSFSGYSEGVYNRCNSYNTNHMVTLEGWDDEGEYWIMRNSWGTKWGEDGYMRIKWRGKNGYRCNNIARSAAYVILNPEYVKSLKR